MTIDWEIGQEVYYIDFGKVEKATIQQIIIGEKGITLCGRGLKAWDTEVARSPEALFDALEAEVRERYEIQMAEVAEQRRQYQEEQKPAKPVEGPKNCWTCRNEKHCFRAETQWSGPCEDYEREEDKK